DFVRLNQSTTKLNLLTETLRRIQDTLRILIFCNTQESADSVYQSLSSKAYPALLLASHVEKSQLEKNMRLFQDPAPASLQIAVATDIASRGIDTVHVGHVILYDFPHTVIDYMHRVGRTGRFNRKGRATSFVTNRDVKLAEAIQAVVRSRKALS
ncbi:hypothetical protein HDU91_002304, partial [Kappamyces sp. JEL0680]